MWGCVQIDKDGIDKWSKLRVRYLIGVPKERSKKRRKRREKKRRKRREKKRKRSCVGCEKLPKKLHASPYVIGEALGTIQDYR